MLILFAWMIVMIIVSGIVMEVIGGISKFFTKKFYKHKKA